MDKALIAFRSSHIWDNAFPPNEIPVDWYGQEIEISPSESRPVVRILAPERVEQGERFDAIVGIDRVENMDTFQLHIPYDKNLLEVVGEEGSSEGVSNGNFGSEEIIVSQWRFNPPKRAGILTILGNMAGVSGITGGGSLCVIHFRAKEI